MMAEIIPNPPTPYSTTTPGPLQNGRSIVLHGCIATQPERFAINLICGSKGDKDKDIAFHFNARFDENCIVRNSMVNKKWGTEERGGGFPLQKGVPFNISIHVFPDHFQVVVNGQHFCEFKHRVPLNQINVLGVSDGIKIELLRFDGFPVVYPGVPPPNIGFVTGEAHSQPPPPMYNPNVPLTAPIPGGISPGKMISISGHPHPDAKRFTINFICGSGWKDIALHFDVRFNVNKDKNVIVRNHKANNEWGSEERDIPHFPLIPSTNFDILILCDSAAFKVAVNNQHFIEFAHRIMPPNKIDTLEVSGDVRLTLVRFQ